MENEASTIRRAGENKSAQIRQMFDSGLAKADIARALGVRYQYVRNVLVTYETAKRQSHPREYRVPGGHPGTLTIALSPERESFLVREAAARNISIDEMLSQVLDDFEHKMGEHRLGAAFEQIASQSVGNFAVSTPAHEAQRRAFKELNG